MIFFHFLKTRNPTWNPGFFFKKPETRLSKTRPRSYIHYYEEGGRKRRRTLVIKGVITGLITGVIKGVIKDIDCYEKGGRKREEEKVFC